MWCLNSVRLILILWIMVLLSHDNVRENTLDHHPHFYLRGYLKSYFNIIFPFTPRSLVRSLPFIVSTTILCAFLFFLMHATRSNRLIFLDLFTHLINVVNAFKVYMNPLTSLNCGNYVG